MSNVRERLIRGIRDPRNGVDLSDDVLAYARTHRVHLLLADHTRATSLQADLREATVVETARERELRQVLAALATVGVRPVLLKGVALSRTHYRRPALRPRTDTDLIIPAAARDATTRALIELGYERIREVTGSLTTAQFHLEKHDALGDHALDVHCQISNVRAFANVLSYSELVRDAHRIPSLGPHAWGPSPVHALIIACIHLVAHHGNTDSLLWLLDISLLARSLEPHERDRFAELARSRGIRAVCRSTLMAADRAFGGIDSDWLDALRTQTAEPTAVFLLGPMRQIDILKEDLRATPRLWQRVRIVGEHLFPSSSFMYERYGTRGTFKLPFLYAHRIVTGMGKWWRR
jgi:hypothetical protein